VIKLAGFGTLSMVKNHWFRGYRMLLPKEIRHQCFFKYGKSLALLNVQGKCISQLWIHYRRFFPKFVNAHLMQQNCDLIFAL